MTSSQSPAIVCLSHLGWDYVWQRPQHILSRLAQHYPVLYVRDPLLNPACDRGPHLERVAEHGNVTAWQVVYPETPEVMERWRELYVHFLKELLIQQGWALAEGDALASTRPIILWFYTPTPWYVVDHLPAQLVVYDVMDELANFKGGGQDLREREQLLLTRCDLVFAGGRSLYEARKQRHAHVHLFPSGVDAQHFAEALHPATETAPELAHLPRPVLGYYGVIDERLDLRLIKELAGYRPDWSVVLVGPVTKLEPEQLPVAPNLRYVGQQPYSRLPRFLKGFDVCLMPFALNEATRYISPTKALEYMAAHKPIISTPVPDVVANWAGAVQIAADIEQFIDAANKALDETAEARAERLSLQENLVALHSWDQIASEMGRLIEDALIRRV